MSIQRFEAELGKRLREEIERLSVEILSGNLADLVAYKERAAQRNAYVRALNEFIDDAHRELSKE